MAGPQACNFIKKRLKHRCFPVKFLRTLFSTEQLRWLLFMISNSNNSFQRCFSDISNTHHPMDTSIRRRNSMWKVRGNYINFERQIHVEIMTSIRRGYFDVDSTFKIDEISMSFPRGFFYVVSTSNRRNFCTRCFHSIIFYHFLLWEPILNYSGIMLSRCNFNDIDVITDFGTIRTISFGNIATMQINRITINIIFFKIILTEIIMPI